MAQITFGESWILAALIGLGAIYVVATIVFLVAIVKWGNNILQAATNTVNVLEGIRGEIRTIKDRGGAQN